MSIKFSILEEDGVEYSVPTEKEGNKAILKAGLTTDSVSSDTLVSTTSPLNSPSLMPDMTLILSPGEYLIFMSFAVVMSNNNSEIRVGIYLDGVLEKEVRAFIPTKDTPFGTTIVSKVSIASTSTLEARWGRSSGTASSEYRSLSYIKTKEN
jgi:hypothetical protein